MMSQELLYLFGSVVILLVLIAFQATSAIAANGLSWGFSPRDEPGKTTTLSARAKRAVTNHIEGLVLFGFAILVVETSGLNSGLTAMGGALYFWARLVYAPVYLIGVPVLRTLVWAVSLVGILIELYVIAATGI